MLLSRECNVCANPTEFDSELAWEPLRVGPETQKSSSGERYPWSMGYRRAIEQMVAESSSHDLQVRLNFAIAVDPDISNSHCGSEIFSLLNGDKFLELRTEFRNRKMAQSGSPFPDPVIRRRRKILRRSEGRD